MSEDSHRLHADDHGGLPWGTFDTYGEAAAAAGREGVQDGLVAKVQRSPYGRGFVVRKLPVALLTRPEVRNLVLRPLEYGDL